MSTIAEVDEYVTLYNKPNLQLNINPLFKTEPKPKPKQIKSYHAFYCIHNWIDDSKDNSS